MRAREHKRKRERERDGGEEERKGYTLNLIVLYT